jgi:excisionase family DNA binding protein
MNASEVAAYMGIKEKTVRNWTSKKTIPFTKIGGSVRYKKDDIDEFLKSKSIHPKSKKNKK